MHVTTSQKFSPEYRQEAVRSLLIGSVRSHKSRVGLGSTRALTSLSLHAICIDEQRPLPSLAVVLPAQLHPVLHTTSDAHPHAAHFPA
jgi:hypothetical protein